MAKTAIDVTLGDSWARDLRDALGKRQWRQAEAILNSTRDFDLRDFFVAAASEWEGRPEWLDAWCDAAPGSPFPWLVRGAHSVNWAWEARGGGTGDTVGADAAVTFLSRLQAAEHDLLSAAEIDPMDPTPWSRLITVAQGLGRDLGARRDRFQEATRRDPLNVNAHLRVMVALSWKWGGSHEEMFAVARDAVARAPEGHPLHVVSAEAHIERCLAYGMGGEPEAFEEYLRTEEAVRDIEAAWSRSIGSPRWRPTATAVRRHNTFAFCFWRQRQAERTRKELRAARGILTPSPWRFFGDPASLFDEASRETGQTPSPDPAFAKEIAGAWQKAVASAAKDFKITLDFSEASLAGLDRILGECAAEFPKVPKEKQAVVGAGIAMQFGAYFGEVLRRTLGGTWIEKVPGRDDLQMSLRVGSRHLVPIVTVHRRLTRPEPPSLPRAFEERVAALRTAVRPEPGQAAAPVPPEKQAEAGSGAPAGNAVADDMKKFARAAVADALEHLKLPLDYTAAALPALDAMVDLLRKHAGADPVARKQVLDMAALKLGAYLGEVLRQECGGVWIKDEPGLPPGMPVLTLGRVRALTIPAMRAFLDGSAVDMGGVSVVRPSEYFEETAKKQRAWMDEVLLGGKTREALAGEMSDDRALAETLLVHTGSAILTAATKWELYLDFSEKSLDGVEEVLGHMHQSMKAAGQRPTEEQLRSAALAWGVYVGEVLRRNLGGRWVNTPMPPQGNVLRLKSDRFEMYPARKVEKRLTEGPGDAIPFYFKATRQIIEKGVPESARTS